MKLLAPKSVNKLIKTLFLILLVTLFSCNKILQQNNAKNNTIEQKIDSILSIMTLEEKIGQMSQVRHFADITDTDIVTKHIGSVIHTAGPAPGQDALGWQHRMVELQKQALSSRLGIPLLFGVDAIHGQNTFEGATIFPHNIGMGATYNPSLVEEAAAITAVETQATGFNWTFSPCIAIPYNERWGRVYEAFSESTTLTQKMVKASIRGHQGNLSDPTTVMATAKHFIGDGSTDFGVEGGNTTISMTEVYERLLPPYIDAVNEKVGAVMVSFNTLSDVAMHSNKKLITGLLKDSLKFDGIVVTDWKGYSRFGGNEIIEAGVDMVMAVDGDLDNFQNGLKKAVEDNTIEITRVNDAVKRILRQKFRLGLFENPFPDESLIAKIGCKSHRDKARQAVRESLVLLKNNKEVLPLSKETKKIVVVGEHANSSGLQSGGWTIDWQGNDRIYKGSTTILQGIEKMASGKVVYDSDATGNHFDADVAVIVVGEKPYAEMFGYIEKEGGNHSLTLSEKHIGYINRYVNKGVKVVVLLVSGRPLVVTNEIDIADAFIAAWLPGSEGDGVAEVLFGDYNFKGKLPHTWPKATKDFNGKFGLNLWEETFKPLFPIEFGLTY